jgi:hypothetical protein
LAGEYATTLTARPISSWWQRESGKAEGPPSLLRFSAGESTEVVLPRQVTVTAVLAYATRLMIGE